MGHRSLAGAIRVDDFQIRAGRVVESGVGAEGHLLPVRRPYGVRDPSGPFGEQDAVGAVETRAVDGLDRKTLRQGGVFSSNGGDPRQVWRPALEVRQARLEAQLRTIGLYLVDRGDAFITNDGEDEVGAVRGPPQRGDGPGRRGGDCA